MMKTAEINHLLPHFKLLKSEIANLVNLVSHANNKQRTTSVETSDDNFCKCLQNQT